ncbi:superoxide dismutase [Mycobacterium avium]|uniref:superoxide dismutase n=1 Tax=Mycobacterium avium TaxID=1764 RepID=UPI0023517854|nr:superoxide dismutase [Mycobacterium avium]
MQAQKKFGNPTSTNGVHPMSSGTQADAFTGYVLPPLPYGYDALEPYIDAATMQLHHNKHHQTYVDKLNAAIAPYPQLHGLIIEDLLRRLDEVPDEIRQTVREQGGGHANHQFFWKVIGPPRDTTPQGALADALKRDFGGLDAFKEQFATAAAKQFGSGWAFLVINPGTKKLEILTLPNQDSVLLYGRPGLLACDVWEHAYYLRYQNRRAEYLDAWWNVVAWDVVSRRLDNFNAGKQQL